MGSEMCIRDRYRYKLEFSSSWARTCVAGNDNTRNPAGYDQLFRGTRIDTGIAYNTSIRSRMSAAFVHKLTCLCPFTFSSCVQVHTPACRNSPASMHPWCMRMMCPLTNPSTHFSRKLHKCRYLLYQLHRRNVLSSAPRISPTLRRSEGLPQRYYLRQLQCWVTSAHRERIELLVICASHCEQHHAALVESS